ncbi:hypothetical protein KI387_028000, partial [Taxus chinensis]
MAVQEKVMDSLILFFTLVAPIGYGGSPLNDVINGKDTLVQNQLEEMIDFGSEFFKPNLAPGKGTREFPQHTL